MLKELVEKLLKCKKTISTMESCTGGGVANAVTNILGASEVLKFSAVTYSNEFKIKMGVSSEVIDKYSVYSMETAEEMSKHISIFTDSDYGIGITGKLNASDSNNPEGLDNAVFISIFDKKLKKYHNTKIEVPMQSREKNKELIIKTIEKVMLNILDNN